MYASLENDRVATASVAPKSDAPAQAEQIGFDI